MSRDGGWARALGWLLLAVAAVGAGCSPRSPRAAPPGDEAGAAPRSAPGGSGAAPDAVLWWGGPGRTAGRFYQPRAMAAGNGRLYVVDMSGRIQVFDLEGNWQASWRLPEVTRGYPTGLGVAPDGRLAVADTHNYVVRLYSPQGELLRSMGREGPGPGEFTYLTDVEFDAQGNMFVSERGREDRVQKFDPQGRFLTTWGRSGEAPGEFHRPQGLAVDEEGSVYVADAANHRIQKFSNDGELLAVWGGPGREPGQLLYPYDLAVGPGGLLFVGEYGNNRIQAFDRRGRSVKVWGEPGRGPGQLASPWAVCWVEGRGLYVADTGNNRVQLFVGAPGVAWAGSAP